MFTLIRSMSWRALFQEQFPVFIVSFVLAEIFYKFHSFTLEAGAFLLTWLALDGLVQLVKRVLYRRPDAAAVRRHIARRV